MQFDLMKCWYRKSLHPVAMLLLPLSWLFGCGVALRRLFFRIGLFKTCHFDVPVIVVGNITVGGTGKTPFVISLVKLLQSHGYRPGIVSRGVGGKRHTKPHRVRETDKAGDVGDEALLLLQNTHCPVVIGVDRVAAVRELLRQSACDIVISDDGLQHYHLGRDLEIVMVDAERGYGNECLLPAGPLREPVSRLKKVDMVVINGGAGNDRFTMTLEPAEFVSVKNPQKKISLSEFSRDKIHAVTGIGNPHRFFMTLTSLGFDLVRHVFPDHYLYLPHDIDFKDNLKVMMTEKDAVKCRAIVNEHYWYLRITAKINNRLEQAILLKLKSLEACDEHKKAFTNTSDPIANRVQCDDIRS
jgi:tetraacyldisaccharide 4'-kinase